MTDLNSAKQQADDDLTWLARNVHRWVGGDYLIRVGKIDYTFREHCEGETALPNWYTRDQWLTRRAKLQNNPSWKDAPEWAEWLAQDEDGEWKWLASPSGRYVDGWTATKIKGCCKGLVLGDWRNTLERRPQEAKSEPNQEPSSDGWHKRGELPPVGTVCLYVISDRLSREVEITAHAKLGICFAEIGKLDERYVSKTAELHRFRPMPTERERVASELVDVMMAVPVSDRKTASESFMSMALAIYDHLYPESRV